MKVKARQRDVYYFIKHFIQCFITFLYNDKSENKCLKNDYSFLFCYQEVGVLDALHEDCPQKGCTWWDYEVITFYTMKKQYTHKKLF